MFHRLILFVALVCVSNAAAFGRQDDPMPEEFVPSFGTPYVVYDIYNGTGGICGGAFSRSVIAASGVSVSITLSGCE